MIIIKVLTIVITFKIITTSIIIIIIIIIILITDCYSILTIDVMLTGGQRLVEAPRLLEKMHYCRKKTKQGGAGVEDMEYPGIKKKKKNHVDFQGS